MKDILKTSLIALVISLSTLGVYSHIGGGDIASNWAEAPSGEVKGGKFMNLLNDMLAVEEAIWDGDGHLTTSSTVHQSNKIVDNGATNSPDDDTVVAEVATSTSGNSTGLKIDKIATGTENINDTYDIVSASIAADEANFAALTLGGVTETAWPDATEADTLATVTARGGTTSTNITVTGGTYGISGVGTGWGTHGRDSSSGAYAYLGYDIYGVRSIGSGNYGLYSRDGDGSSYTHLNYDNYGVYTNTPIYTSSSVYANSFIYNSDRNLKEDIRVVNNALDRVLQLEGVSFKWKENGEAELGLIAQDVEEVFPDLVVTNDVTGLKAVKYGNLVAPLIEAVKAQQTEMEAQQAEIDALRAEIEQLKNEN